MAKQLVLPVDTTNLSCSVALAPAPKMYKGVQRTDFDKQPEWVTQLVGVHPSMGAIVMSVTTAGSCPEVGLGQVVQPQNLRATVYTPESRKPGEVNPPEFAFKADGIVPIPFNSPNKKMAAASA